MDFPKQCRRTREVLIRRGHEERQSPPERKKQRQEAQSVTEFGKQSSGAQQQGDEKNRERTDCRVTADEPAKGRQKGRRIVGDSANDRFGAAVEKASRRGEDPDCREDGDERRHGDDLSATGAASPQALRREARQERHAERGEQIELNRISQAPQEADREEEPIERERESDREEKRHQRPR